MVSDGNTGTSLWEILPLIHFTREGRDILAMYMEFRDCLSSAAAYYLLAKKQ